MNRILELLEQIILAQKEIDKQETLRAIKEHTMVQTLGTSWMSTYLHNLKELIIEEDKRLGNIIQPNHKGQIHPDLVIEDGIPYLNPYFKDGFSLKRNLKDSEVK